MDIIKKIFIFLFFFIFCYLPSQAIAANLIVDFYPDPLFKSINIAPGNSVSGFVKVTNTSGQTQKVVAEDDNVIDSNNFSSYLNLIIKQDEKILFNDSLKNFFIAKEVFLSELENEFSVIYEFIITFDSSVLDNLQGKSLENFDLLVGFLGQEKIAVTQSRSSGANPGSVYEKKEIENIESEKEERRKEKKEIKEIKDNSEQANPVNSVNPVNLRLNQGQVAGQSDIEQQQPEQIAEEQEQLREQPQEQKQEQKNSATEIYFITGFIFLFLAIIYLIKIIKNRTRKNN